MDLNPSSSVLVILSPDFLGLYSTTTPKDGKTFNHHRFKDPERQQGIVFSTGIIEPDSLGLNPSSAEYQLWDLGQGTNMSRVSTKAGWQQQLPQGVVYGLILTLVLGIRQAVNKYKLLLLCLYYYCHVIALGMSKPQSLFRITSPQFNSPLYFLPIQLLKSECRVNLDSLSFPHFSHLTGPQVPGPFVILPLKYWTLGPSLLLLPKLRPMIAVYPGLVTSLPLFSPSLIFPSRSLNS